MQKIELDIDGKGITKDSVEDVELDAVTKDFSILNLFSPDEIQEKADGSFKTTCPSCGLQGGRTEGLILFPETNTWYCHSSFKHGGMLEYIAMKYKLITCVECNESGEKRHVLAGEMFKDVLDILKDNYPLEIYENILSILKIRSKIELPGNGILISKFANELGSKFHNKDNLFFREDINEIVEVVNNGFKIIKSIRFITLAERYFFPWTKIWKKNGDVLEITRSMPQQTAGVVLASPNFQNKLLRIKRIFTSPIPIIHEGKLTFPKKGYDKRFNSWLNFNTPVIKKLPLNEAKDVFLYIFNEFCFQKKQDYVNAIAALITPFLRGLYPDFNERTPMFCYMANRERLGKDFCAAITGIVLEGIAIEEPPISSGEYGSTGSNDELRKKIVAVMISGRKRLHFSNNKGRLNNAVLEGFLTSRYFSDRLLGKNENVSFSNEIDVSISGNIGMTFTPDLINRSIPINFFYAEENANNRKFKNPNLHEWVLNNRDIIISSIYALIKNWYDKKMPNGKLPFASYPEWAKICGGILEAADIGNPCTKENNIQNVSLDQETDEMIQLFEYVFGEKPNEWLKKSDIKQMVIDSDESIFTYYDWDKRADQTKFGFKLDKFVGRILSDIKLVCEDITIRAARRNYKFVIEKADFDKKSVFGNVGNVGNLYPIPEIPIRYRDLKSSGDVTKVTKVTTPKNDREIQFYDAEECSNIKTTCNKDDILTWIKTNPKEDYKKLYQKFGTGSLKIRNKLQKEGLI